MRITFLNDAILQYILRLYLRELYKTRANIKLNLNEVSRQRVTCYPVQPYAASYVLTCRWMRVCVCVCVSVCGCVFYWDLLYSAEIFRLVDLYHRWRCRWQIFQQLQHRKGGGIKETFPEAKQEHVQCVWPVWTRGAGRRNLKELETHFWALGWRASSVIWLHQVDFV